MSVLERFSLQGRVAVVTGGGSGLGLAGAMALAEAGADIALVARDRARLEAAAGSVEVLGRRCLVVEADVTDAAAVEGAARKVQEAFGRTDILFNNAGITNPQPLLEIEPEAFARVIEVNLTGAYLCMRAFAPAMIDGGYGRIVNMGSILSARGMANRGAYCASKAGLANLAAAAAFEFGPSRVTVNTIGATVIVTDLNRELIKAQPSLYDQVLRRQAIARLGQPEDLAGALVFLASPAAEFVTGQTLYVDGGYTAG